MQYKQWIKGIGAGCILAAGSVFAAVIQPVTEQIQVPKCLASELGNQYPVLAQNQQYKILDVPAKSLNDIARLADKSACGRFVNVSHRLQKVNSEEAQKILAVKPQLVKEPAINYELKHAKDVEQAMAQVNEDNIWRTLVHMTSYYNRSATTKRGAEVAQWVKGRFESMAETYHRTDTDTFLVDTGFWYKQPSVVSVIGKDLKEPGIVIGAHIDTLDGRMPGAGDDGSGSSSAMEVARVLLANHYDFKRPIYIIWYAAEERGLVGSQYVVKYFKENNIPVKAAIQFDMTGYRSDAKDPTIWVYRDFTDKPLSDFVANLLKTYVQVPVGYSSCGYGCSDHASWMEGGIPAAFPCETAFDVHNPYIHTIDDDLSLISAEHMSNFTKLGLAFAIELASE